MKTSSRDFIRITEAAGTGTIASDLTFCSIKDKPFAHIIEAVNKVNKQYFNMSCYSAPKLEKVRTGIMMWILCLFCSLVSSCISGQSKRINEFQSNMIEPISIVKIGKGHFFVDFGKDAFGTLVLKTKFTQKDTLIIHLGEKVINTCRIDRKPGGSIRYQRRYYLPGYPQILIM